jgi:hypothetical protein
MLAEPLAMSASGRVLPVTTDSSRPKADGQNSYRLSMQLGELVKQDSCRRLNNEA